VGVFRSRVLEGVCVTGVWEEIGSGVSVETGIGACSALENTFETCGSSGDSVKLCTARISSSKSRRPKPRSRSNSSV